MKPRFRLPGFWLVAFSALALSPVGVSAASAAPGGFGGAGPFGGLGAFPGGEPVKPVDAPPGVAPGDSDAAREAATRLARELKFRSIARRAFLASARGRAERERSRRAFRGFSDARALALLKRKFSGMLRPAVPDARSLVGRDRVVDFLGDHVARVEGLGGRPDRLIDASIPLRALDGGRKRLVDLDLEREGDGFVAVNGLVGVRLPATAGDPVRFGPLGVTLPGESGAEKLDAGTLAYPNVAVDTDMAVNLSPSGFEVFHQLRSSEAPEVQRYRLDLPAGAVLRATAAGGAEIVQGGDVKVVVRSPMAVDAQGEPVPASYRIDGDELAVAVRHRSESVAYPVLLDPEFQAVDNYACSYGTGACGMSWFKGNSSALQRLSHWGWFQSNPNSSHAAYKNCFNYPWFNDCYGPGNGGGSNWNLGGGGDGNWSVGQTGLHAIIYPNTWYAGGGEIGEWVYTTPARSDDPHGRTTQIYRAEFGAKWLRKRTSPSYPVMFTGVYSYADGNWVPGGLTYHDPYGSFGLNDNWNAHFGSARGGPQAAAFGFINP